MASSYANIHPVDQILTSLVVETVPSDDQLIANKIFETIKVPERSGTLLLEETRNFMGAGAGLDLERAAANFQSVDLCGFGFNRDGRHLRFAIRRKRRSATRKEG